jgi:predicted ribosome quality control (RQC) complex YloA/Tae2 family protein
VVLASDLYAALAKATERERRKNAALVAEATRAAEAEALGQWAELVVSNLYRIPDGAASVLVDDWNGGVVGGSQTLLTFNREKYASPRHEADAAFDRARRLRRGSVVIRGLLAASAFAAADLEALRLRVDAAAEAIDPAGALAALRNELAKPKLAARLGLKLLPLEPRVQSTSVAEVAAAAGSLSLHETFTGSVRPPAGWTGRTFISPRGVLILVGRNKNENDRLTCKIAREPDVWMHARGSPGAHVVLQLSRAPAPARGGTSSPEQEDPAAEQARRSRQSDDGEEEDDEDDDEKGDDEEQESNEACLQMAANLAILYSDLRTEKSAWVTVASPKQVFKPPGSPPGAVVVRKELGSRRGVPDDAPNEEMPAAPTVSARAGGKVSSKTKASSKTNPKAPQPQAKEKGAGDSEMGRSTSGRSRKQRGSADAEPEDWY